MMYDDIAGNEYDHAEVWGWIDNPLSTSQVSTIETGLRSVESEFERLGGRRWYRDMMDRWSEIKRHARGVDRSPVVEELARERF
jgi:hypothetical protein